MSAASRNAAKLEEHAAKQLGVKRIRRKRVFQRAPDMTALRLPSGVVLQAEAKFRTRLPKLVTDALKQAQRYSPSSIAVAILREKGGRALVALDLDAFCRLLGIKPEIAGEQLGLLARAS